MIVDRHSCKYGTGRVSRLPCSHAHGQTTRPRPSAWPARPGNATAGARRRSNGTPGSRRCSAQAMHPLPGYARPPQGVRPLPRAERPRNARSAPAGTPTGIRSHCGRTALSEPATRRGPCRNEGDSQPTCSDTLAAHSCPCVARACSAPRTAVLCAGARTLATATTQLGDMARVHNAGTTPTGRRRLHTTRMAPLRSTHTLRVCSDAATLSSAPTHLSAAATSLGSVARIHDRQAGESCRRCSSSSPGRHARATHSAPRVGHTPDPATSRKALAGRTCRAL